MKFGVMFGVCWHASTINKVGKLRNELLMKPAHKKYVYMHMSLFLQDLLAHAANLSACLQK